MRETTQQRTTSPLRRTSPSTDVKRLSAPIKAITDVKPKVHSMEDGTATMKCAKGRLENFAHYARLADVKQSGWTNQD